MTHEDAGATILFMANKGKPGRRPGTPLEYQEALKRRLKVGRETVALEMPQMAAALTKLMGRVITADSYRKWESESLLPHDAILPVCDLLKVHVFKFLGELTDEEREVIKKSAGQKIRYLKQTRSGS